MSIRYFFIASAITSGLSLAINESDGIVNTEPSPIVAYYTDNENKNFLRTVSNTSDELNILKTQTSVEAKDGNIEKFYKKLESLLSKIDNFCDLVIKFFSKLISPESSEESSSSSS